MHLRSLFMDNFPTCITLFSFGTFFCFIILYSVMNILNWALLYCLKFSHISVSLLLILEVAQKFPCLLFADSLAVSVSFASQTAQYHGLQGTSKRISIPNGKVLGH